MEHIFSILHINILQFSLTKEATSIFLVCHWLFKNCLPFITKVWNTIKKNPVRFHFISSGNISTLYTPEPVSADLWSCHPLEQTFSGWGGGLILFPRAYVIISEHIFGLLQFGRKVLLTFNIERQKMDAAKRPTMPMSASPTENDLA